MLVDVTVVHDDHQIAGRERLHLVQGTLNELIECIHVERAFNYVAVNHAVTE
jgi:hypothetical protein